MACAHVIQSVCSQRYIGWKWTQLDILYPCLYQTHCRQRYLLANSDQGIWIYYDESTIHEQIGIMMLYNVHMYILMGNGSET